VIELVEVEPGKFRVKRPALKPARSDLPLPYVISDIMPPTEQVDGKFYTSKREFRAVGKAHGLIEIGTEKLKPKQRITSTKEERRASIKKAIEQYKSR
jgi:hypothetical protein